MDPVALILVLGGGVLAGIINTVAGGGSIITLPLLIFTGLPAGVANGTNRIAIVLQGAGALAGFKKHGYTVGRRTWLLLIPSLLGAFVGARLAVGLDEATLRRAIGVILIFTLVPILRKTPRTESGIVSPPTPPWVWPVYFAIGVYGGFIQAGVGFMYLTLLVGVHAMSLVRANLIKVFLVFVFSILALAVFFFEGQVSLLPGLVLAAGMMVGGWLGAQLAVEKGERWIRVVLVLAVLGASAKLLGMF